MRSLILGTLAAILLAPIANAQTSDSPFICVVTYETRHRMYWLDCGGRLEPMGRLDLADLKKIKEGERFRCTGMDSSMGPTGCTKQVSK